MPRLLLVVWLFVVSPLLGQDALQQLITLTGERTRSTTATFDKGDFQPDTVFRGKTLIQWLEDLRDADAECTARPAKNVWMAMGPKAVPFLVQAESLLDWEHIEFGLSPHDICLGMRDRAVDPLIRLLASPYTFSAWLMLNGIINALPGDRVGLTSDGEFRPLVRTKEEQEGVDAQVGKVIKGLGRCLGQSDAATRLAALLLLDGIVVMKGPSHETWGSVPVGARRLLEKDLRNEVRGAACELLVDLGLDGVPGGLTHEELKKMAHPNGNPSEVDTTLPREVAQAVVMGILQHGMRSWRLTHEKAVPPLDK